MSLFGSLFTGVAALNAQSQSMSIDDSQRLADFVGCLFFLFSFVSTLPLRCYESRAPLH